MSCLEDYNEEFLRELEADIYTYADASLSSGTQEPTNHGYESES